MKKNKLTVMVLAALVLVTAAAAVWHLGTRAAAPEGTLRIETGTTVTELSLSRLPLTKVQGTVVNGKGEEKTIDAQGVPLSAVLSEAGITGCTRVLVVAEDEYSATVEAAEIAETGRVYLLISEDERPRLVVFGDKDSKRKVSDVARLVVE